MMPNEPYEKFAYPAAGVNNFVCNASSYFFMCLHGGRLTCFKPEDAAGFKIWLLAGGAIDLEALYGEPNLQRYKPAIAQPVQPDRYCEYFDYAAGDIATFLSTASGLFTMSLKQTGATIHFEARNPSAFREWLVKGGAVDVRR